MSSLGCIYFVDVVLEGEIYFKSVKIVLLVPILTLLECISLQPFLLFVLFVGLFIYWNWRSLEDLGFLYEIDCLIDDDLHLVGFCRTSLHPHDGPIDTGETYHHDLRWSLAFQPAQGFELF